MSSFIVVVIDPLVQIFLKLLHGVVKFFTERNLVELLQDGLVEPLADSVCLRGFNFRFRVVDIIDSQIQLIVMRLGAATVFRSPIR